jgi:hypothetical protein
MDYAPGHFEAFERNNIQIIFFPPNCTSWKQPCDMGIIVALKKRYKYLYLKDVLDFYELDDEVKNRKKDQGRRLHRGAIGVLYQNPAHLFDAASYVKDAWDYVSQTSIKNAFVKAKLMNLKPKLEAGNEVDDLCTKFSKAMESLNLSVDTSKLEEFVHINNEDNEKYATAILADVEELLEMMMIDETMMDDDGDVNTQELNVSLENKVIFQGFDFFYKQVSTSKISCYALKFKQK